MAGRGEAETLRGAEMPTLPHRLHGRLMATRLLELEPTNAEGRHLRDAIIVDAR
jgi:hypothetical protein